MTGQIAVWIIVGCLAAFVAGCFLLMQHRYNVRQKAATKARSNRIRRLDHRILTEWELQKEGEIQVLQKPKKPEAIPRDCTGCWCAVRKESL